MECGKIAVVMMKLILVTGLVSALKQDKYLADTKMD